MLVDHGIIEETPEKVGTRFWHEYEEKGRRFQMKGVVTEHAPPERMGVELDGPAFGLKVDYEFEEFCWMHSYEGYPGYGKCFYGTNSGDCKEDAVYM